MDDRRRRQSQELRAAIAVHLTHRWVGFDDAATQVTDGQSITGTFKDAAVLLLLFAESCEGLPLPCDVPEDIDGELDAAALVEDGGGADNRPAYLTRGPAPKAYSSLGTRLTLEGEAAGKLLKR